MDCPRETEVLEWIRLGRGESFESLAAADVPLRDHLRTCPDCRELVLVASAFVNDEAPHHVHVPSSGVAWWRTQRRALQDGARTTRRAMTLVQGLTVLAAIFIAIFAVGAISFDSWIDFARSALTTQTGILLTLLLVVSATLAPVAVYFAFTRE